MCTGLPKTISNKFFFSALSSFSVFEPAACFWPSEGRQTTDGWIKPSGSVCPLRTLSIPCAVLSQCMSTGAGSAAAIAVVSAAATVGCQSYLPQTLCKVFAAFSELLLADLRKEAARAPEPQEEREEQIVEEVAICECPQVCPQAPEGAWRRAVYDQVLTAGPELEGVILSVGAFPAFLSYACCCRRRPRTRFTATRRRVISQTPGGEEEPRRRSRYAIAGGL